MKNPSTAKIVYDFLRSTCGATRLAACAILGNIEQESGMVSDVNEVGGGGYGLVQWTGPRRRSLINWCKSNGYNYKSIDGQLAFLWHEISTYKAYKKAFDTINSYADEQSNLAKATEVWERGFERAGKPNMPRRIKFANEWWNFFVVEGADSGGKVSAEDTEKVTEQTKPITSVFTLDVIGKYGIHENNLSARPIWRQRGLIVAVENNGTTYIPAVLDGAQLEQSRKGSPAKLIFTVLKDKVVNISEGDSVILVFAGIGMFSGFVFEKNRSDRDKIKITCYDQLRYLKNNDSLSFSKTTYSDMLKHICQMLGLKMGYIEDTTTDLLNVIEECSYLEMLQNASDFTVMSVADLYVLYDDFGKITLRDIKDLKLNILIDDETAREFEYTSSVDKNVYTRIKFAADDKQTGIREVMVWNYEDEQELYGILNLYANKDDKFPLPDVTDMVDVYKKLFTGKNRTLLIKGLPGDPRIRPGSSLIVRLNLGDLYICNRMLVEHATHTFKAGEFTTDVTLSGIRGEFRDG